MVSVSDDSKSTSSDTRKGKNEAVSSSKPPKTISKKRRAKEKLDRKKKSWVWDHFTTETKPLFKKEDGKEVQVGHTKRAKCRYCSIDFASDSTKNGTSTLQKHLEQHCDHYPGSVKNLGKGQGHFAVDIKGKDAVVTHWTQENCTKAAVEMIVIDEMPFSAIEKLGFRRFCKVAIPKWNVPCRKTVVKNFLNMYKEMKEDLKAELRDHCISLTTDTWTSIQNINYMVVTAHFIDNSWTMHKRVLNFCVIPNHQGLAIGKLLEKCLQDWSIKKLLTISVDNASSNKVALDYVKRKLSNGDKQLLLGGKFLHVRCLAHVVNLIVKSGLRCMEKSVASIRNAVKYVRSSSARLDAFKDCVKKEELESKKVCVLDVPTRWNSTYIMLDTALELRRAFDRLAEEEDSKFNGYFDEEEEEDEEDDLGFGIVRKGRKRVGPPVEDDWGRAVEFVKFLRIFFETTMNICATNKPTAHKAFVEIVTIKSEIDDIYNTPSTIESATEKTMFDMSIQVRSKYKKYFDEIDDMNNLLLVALVLDPRYKLKYFSFVLEKMLGYDIEIVKKKSEQLKDLVVTLTDLYASSHGTQSSNTRKDISESGSSSSKRQLSGKRASMLEDWEKDLEDGNAVVVAHEVDRYLLDPIEKPSESNAFNILTWWRLMGPKYPNLQAMAKDVLAIQVSTVASESSFSTGKRVIDPHRSSLTPRSVEALICLQNWLKSDAITSLAYTPTPEEMEWFEKTEQEFEQEEKEERESTDKRKEKDIVEKKSKVAKASKGLDAGNASKN